VSFVNEAPAVCQITQTFCLKTLIFQQLNFRNFIKVENSSVKCTYQEANLGALSFHSILSAKE
jgi:hypothetical protein